MTGGSADHSILGQNLQLAERQIPVLITPFPVLHDPLRSQIQHPAQGITIGERGIVFGDLAKLAIESFDVRINALNYDLLIRILCKFSQKSKIPS